MHAFTRLSVYLVDVTNRRLLSTTSWTIMVFGRTGQSDEPCDYCKYQYHRNTMVDTEKTT